MKNIIVLFNLKAGANAETYEIWAKSTDLPIVNRLESVSKFEVFRTTGLLGSQDPAPYQYAELLAINDFDKFGQEVSTDTMKEVALEFQTFADEPLFITLENI